MGKSEMMKRYEEETGESARDDLYSGSMRLYMPTNDYIAWLESKAAAYDRLMSGGKKTLKEWANILGMPFAVDYNGDGFAFPKTPVCYVEAGDWDSSGGGYIIVIPCHLIDFTGDWTTSLTLPDGWEEKCSKN